MLEDGDEALADLFNRGLADYDSLNPTELTRFRLVVSQMVAACEQTFQEWDLGVLDPESLETQKMGVNYLKSPGGRKWWITHKANFSPSFRTWIDSEFGFDAKQTA